jgi:hypothetical protein
MNAQPGFVGSLLVALASAPIGCTSDLNAPSDLPYAPDNCSRDAPATGRLIALVTINPENPAVKVTVFVGDWQYGSDHNVVAAEDSARTDRIVFELPSDYYYSAVARYIAGADTVLHLDGAKLEVKSEEFRDATCYTVPDVDVNVRLVKSNARSGAEPAVVSREPDPDAVGGPGGSR